MFFELNFNYNLFLISFIHKNLNIRINIGKSQSSETSNFKLENHEVYLILN